MIKNSGKHIIEFVKKYNELTHGDWQRKLSEDETVFVNSAELEFAKSILADTIPEFAHTVVKILLTITENHMAK